MDRGVGGSVAASRQAATPLGILAGGSGVPIELAEAVSRSGRSVHIVALNGEAEPEIAAFSHTWVSWGAIGAIIRAFRTAGCRDIVIVGRVRRPNLAAIRPDLGFWTSLPALLPLLRGGDDAILRIVIGFFERHGLRVVGAHEAAPELLAPAGVLGRHQPGPDDLTAIRAAAAALSALGPLDAAQAAVCSSGGLLAIEGADGTDAMLDRLAIRRGRTREAANGVLVKLPKPQQERRIDLPAIGPETVRRAAAAGLAGIAIRAGETLIAERRSVIAAADAAGLYLVGAGPEQLDAIPRPNEHADEQASGRMRLAALGPIGRHAPRGEDMRDAELAAGVIAALEPFWAQSSAVVSRRYVLATEGPGGALGAADRAGRLKPWGGRLLRRRVGVLVMADVAGELGLDPTTIITRAAKSGLAGLAVLRAPLDATALAVLAAEADRAGMFLLAPGGAL